jgi:phenylpropionate dioxygenase-like ring-hydroxylating dioxygenase large terminal subunit
VRPPLDGEPGPGKLHPQSWYALALTDEVGERPLGVDFLGGRVAVYRRGSGEPVALTARCPHMGADLSLGEVVGDELRCMFHHFRYGPDGRCAGVPTGERPPLAARVFSYPAVERWGLIWAFNGPEPLFEPPALRGYDERQLVVRARRTAPFPVEPWVIIANSFDFQHLRYVHGLRFDFDAEQLRQVDDFHVEYDIEFESPAIGRFTQAIRVCGINTVSYVTRAEVDSMGLFTSTPTGRASQSFYVAATPPGADSAARLALQEKLADDLLVDDLRSFAGMRFREGTLLGADRALRRYFDWVRRFPCADPAGDFR